MPCGKIDSVLGQDFTLNLYPGCLAFYNGKNAAQEVVVAANFNSTDPMEISASLAISFGVSGWLALWIHVILIEFYVSTGNLAVFLRQTNN